MADFCRWNVKNSELMHVHPYYGTEDCGTIVNYVIIAHNVCFLRLKPYFRNVYAHRRSPNQYLFQMAVFCRSNVKNGKLMLGHPSYGNQDWGTMKNSVKIAPQVGF